MVDNIYNWQQFIPKSVMPNDIGTDNYKFFSWLFDYTLKMYDNEKMIEEWKDVNNAQGKALDDMGKNYGEYRGEADDDFFRFMIKARILASRSKATADDIINVIAQSLNLDKTHIKLQSNRQYLNGQFTGIPYSISLKNLPLSFTASDFEKRYLLRTIENASAAGIDIKDISFLDTTHASMFVSAFAAKRVKYTVASSVTANQL